MKLTTATEKALNRLLAFYLSFRYRVSLVQTAQGLLKEQLNRSLPRIN